MYTSRLFETDNEYLAFIARTGLPSDAGNVYQVILTSKAFYSDFYANKQFQYSDGSWAVYPDSGNGLGIQAAINACKGGRNDYILVGTGSYTLTVALTLAGKSSVHLIAVNGGGLAVGTMGAAALTQTGNYQNVIMSPYSEVTGFQMINKVGYSAVTVADGIWRPNIHHNYFHMVGGSDINIISAAGSGLSHSRVCNNRFSTWVGGVLNSAIYNAGGNACDISNNIITVNGATVVMDVGIYNGGDQTTTDNNVLQEANSAVITLGIVIAPTASAAGNRFMIAAGRCLFGGSANLSYSDNRNGVAGGETCIVT